MKVRRLTSDGDMTFGQGLANFATGSEAIRQNVVTRIKCFKNDWFLNTSEHIDWFNILGTKNNKNIILSEILRVTKETYGVIKVTKIELESESERNAIINLNFTTIYDDEIYERITI